MGKINWGRVVLGGLLAGVVLNVYDWLMNGVILMNAWTAALQALGKGQMGGSTVAWFVVCDFLLGIWTLWLYAGIRPRYGAGPKTALIAGLGAWALYGFINTLSAGAMGLLPASLFHWNLIGALIVYPLAAMAGAALYKEA